MTHPFKGSDAVLIHSLITDKKPQSILQIGTGCYELSKTVCDALSQEDNIHYTLVASPADAEVLERLSEEGLDNNLEVINLPADLVLPDLHFQHLTFDLAIINDDAFAESFVSFYYINKMLNKGDCIVIRGVQHAETQQLCRRIMKTADYQMLQASVKKKSTSLLKRVLQNRYQALPAWLQTPVSILINPALLEADQLDVLDGSVVIFEKTTTLSETETEDSMDLDMDMDVDAMIKALS